MKWRERTWEGNRGVLKKNKTNFKKRFYLLKMLGGAREMAWSVKCLWAKHEDLSSILSIHVKEKNGHGDKHL